MAFEDGYTGDVVTQAWHDQSFSVTFNDAPTLRVGLASYDGGNSSDLCYLSLPRSDVQCPYAQSLAVEGHSRRRPTAQRRPSVLARSIQDPEVQIMLRCGSRIGKGVHQHTYQFPISDVVSNTGAAASHLPSGCRSLNLELSLQRDMNGTSLVSSTNAVCQLW